MKLRAHILARLMVAGGLAFSALAFTTAVHAADLVEVYQRALQNDPLIREADANRLASREAKPQALAALLPQLNVNGTYSKFDQDGSRTTLFADPAIPNSPLVPRAISSVSDIDARQ